MSHTTMDPRHFSPFQSEQEAKKERKCLNLASQILTTLFSVIIFCVLAHSFVKPESQVKNNDEIINIFVPSVEVVDVELNNSLSLARPIARDRQQKRSVVDDSHYHSSANNRSKQDQAKFATDHICSCSHRCTTQLCLLSCLRQRVVGAKDAILV